MQSNVQWQKADQWWPELGWGEHSGKEQWEGPQGAWANSAGASLFILLRALIVSCSPAYHIVYLGQAWWLTPVIPDTQEAEIRRIIVQDQPRIKVIETPSQLIS
jgi:hypothetical protein